MSDDEEREGKCRMEEERDGRRERGVGDCFTNRIPLINHPV